FTGAIKPDALERPNGWHVADVASGQDNFHSGLVQDPVDDRPRCFGCVAAAATTRDDAVADFHRPRVIRRTDEADVSDDAVRLAVDHHPDTEGFEIGRAHV